MPIGYQHLGGLCESEKPLPRSVQRKTFEKQIINLVENLKNHIDLDSAIDTFSLKNYYTNSLPPSISNCEFTFYVNFFIITKIVYVCYYFLCTIN